MLMAYDDDGPGPVVVLLHGFPLDRSIWKAQATTLGARYRVIAPDLRGHGETPAPEGIYPMDDMADDVVELLDALKITEPVVVGGLSMGGYVALSMAVRHPRRLRGLMLINTRAAADPPATAQVREELARQVEAAGSAGPAVATMLPKLFGPTARTRRPEVVAAVAERMEKTPARGVAGALRGMAGRPDRTADLPRITLPTLVVAGADDALIPIDESTRMAEALPGAQLVVIPDVGHLAPVEDPEATSAAIRKFLDGLA